MSEIASPPEAARHDALIEFAKKAGVRMPMLK
jgi:hypothetical protein